MDLRKGYTKEQHCALKDAIPILSYQNQSALRAAARRSAMQLPR